MKLIKLPLLAFLYFSVATVVAETAALAVVWAKGGLTGDKMFQVMAVANDVDLRSMRDRLRAARQPVTTEHVSYEEVQHARTLLSLDLGLREMAADKGLADIRARNNQYNAQWEQYKQLKDRFDWDLTQLREGATDQAVKDVRRQLESISPKLAKDQILRLLDDQSVDPGDSMNFVVAIFKGLSLDKRKRIMGEFKKDETERLHEVLSKIRKGEPDIRLFRKTRQQLRQFNLQPVRGDA